jgi:hypothetical protein
MRVRFRIACYLALVLSSFFARAQPDSPISVQSKDLPHASLWERYRFELRASGGIEPYHWSIIAGQLPRDIKLQDHGEFIGIPDESGQFDFTVLVIDNARTIQQKQKMSLNVETPLAADWERRANVTGQRIDGSIKVSNHTGRDFDLTLIVLAVNEIGRATAMGYQHFPLKKDTRDLEISFGDTLSRGNYEVNVDVVGEEPISSRIFRARLVTGKEQVTQGP